MAVAVSLRYVSGGVSVISWRSANNVAYGSMYNKHLVLHNNNVCTP